MLNTSGVAQIQKSKNQNSVVRVIDTPKGQMAAVLLVAERPAYKSERTGDDNNQSVAQWVEAVTFDPYIIGKLQKAKPGSRVEFAGTLALNVKSEYNGKTRYANKLTITSLNFLGGSRRTESAEAEPVVE